MKTHPINSSNTGSSLGYLINSSRRWTCYSSILNYLESRATAVPKLLLHPTCPRQPPPSPSLSNGSSPTMGLLELVQLHIHLMCFSVTNANSQRCCVSDSCSQIFYSHNRFQWQDLFVERSWMVQVRE